MPQYLVPDSSVIVKWLNRADEKYLEQADKLISEVLEGKFTLIAPELAKYEVGNSLLYGKKLSIQEAEITLTSFFILPIKFIHLDKGLTIETYKIAKKFGITFYDASFVTLAKQENAILVTDNPKHQGKIKEVKIIALKNYPM